MKFYGLYGGIVINNSDPLSIQRLKVRVPVVNGPAAPGVGLRVVSDAELPWALPMGIPSGGTSDSGGAVIIPNPQDQVWVMFLDGDPEKPVWSWGNQNVNQRKVFPFATYGTKAQAPNRAYFTRYGHLFEINKSGALMASQSGYAIFASEGSSGPTGATGMRSALGYVATLDDAGQVFAVLAPNFSFVGTTALFTATSFRVDVIDDVTITGPDSSFNLAVKAFNAALSSVQVSVSGNVNLTSEKGFTLTSGSTVVTISPSGVSISAPVVNIV